MSVSLRVIQLCNTHQPADGGPARNSFDLNLALNGKPGVRADLCWIAGPWEGSLGWLHSEGGGSLPTPGPRALRLASGSRTQSVSSFLRALRDADALIVHGLFLWWVPLALAAAKLSRTPVLLMPHGALTKYDLAKNSSAKRTFLKFVRRHIQIFAVGSIDEAIELQSELPDARVDVVGVGTRVPEMRMASSPRSDISILSISRLAPKKRVDLLIRAVAELQHRGHSVEATIAGDGPKEHADYLSALAQEVGVDDRVRFVGFVSGSQKEALYAGATVFALPSEDENFGIGVAEALVRGLPTVASRKVAAAGMLGEPYVSFIDDLTVTALANAIEKAGEDPPLPSETAVAAAEAFSWDATAQRWLNSLLSVGAAPRDGEPAC